MEEAETSDDRRRRVHIRLLSIGVVATVAGQCFALWGREGYALSWYVFRPLLQPVFYTVILGVIALLYAAIRTDIKRHWLPAMAWLFFLAGGVDLVFWGLRSLGR